MLRENRAFVAVLLVLMVWLGAVGCGSSESGDRLVPALDNTANAQAPTALPESQAIPPLTAPRAGPAPQASRTVEIDSTKAQPIFANATRVAPAGRHVVLDFGVKSLPGDGQATTSVRVYMNYYTAKRMQMAMAMSVERHAEVFGALERDEPAELKTPTEVAHRPIYTNFVRLMGTPEELLMEIGINRMPVGIPTEPIRIDFMVIIDYQTGKTLLEQVGSVVSQYEEEHGTIETDVQKRIVGASAP